MIYSRTEALNILGSFCNNLDYLRDRNYNFNLNDFDDMFHKIIFSALQNLSLEKDVINVDEFAIDSFLKKYPIQYATFESNKGIEFIRNIKELSKNSSFDYSYKLFKKFSLLRRYDSVGIDVRDIYDYDSLDVKKLEQQQKALACLSLEEIKKHFKLKLIEIEQEFMSNTDNFSFIAGDGIEELLERCINQESWGLGFQNNYFNAIFRGMLPSKLMIRSGTTGGGKSRQSIGDMCQIACEERFIPALNKWVRNEHTEEVCFISTELTKDELHLAMLSTVAGIPEEVIKDGKYNEEMVERLSKAIKILKGAKIHCEYNSNFSISDVENIIEKNIIRYNVGYVFFDYIQVTSNLALELNKAFGYTLREDQMLNQLSTALKNMCNKYNIFILTSTQLNRNYKFDTHLDASHLRGGMATLDKADYGIITLKVSKADLEKVQPIIDEGFKSIPTHCHHIIKNRGGKWVGIILWVCMDLDTINVEKYCFVTTQDYELIEEVKPINLI